MSPAATPDHNPALDERGVLDEPVGLLDLSATV